jgi:hypothetical protein
VEAQTQRPLAAVGKAKRAAVTGPQPHAGRPEPPVRRHGHPLAARDRRGPEAVRAHHDGWPPGGAAVSRKLRPRAAHHRHRAVVVARPPTPPRAPGPREAARMSSRAFSSLPFVGSGGQFVDSTRMAPACGPEVSPVGGSRAKSQVTIYMRRRRHAAGETVPGLAESTGLPYGTVKAWLSRAAERGTLAARLPTSGARLPPESGARRTFPRPHRDHTGRAFSGNYSRGDMLICRGFA